MTFDAHILSRMNQPSQVLIDLIALRMAAVLMASHSSVLVRVDQYGFVRFEKGDGYDGIRTPCKSVPVSPQTSHPIRAVTNSVLKRRWL